MNVERYVAEIVRKVRAPHKIKRRLREDLTQDIEARLQTGESLSAVIRDMGSASAVAAQIQEEYPVRARTLPESTALIGSIVAAVLAGIQLLNLAYGYLTYRTLQKMLLDTAPASSIGIIGGADGPTAIYTTTNLPSVPLLAALVAAIALLLVYRLLRRRKQ